MSSGYFKHQSPLIPIEFSLWQNLDINQWWIQDFPEEGALTQSGREPIIWPIFPENCMKMKKFWTGGGARSM